MTRPSPPPSVPWRSPRPAGRSSCRRWRNQYLGIAYWAQGDYRRAIDCLGQTVASLDGAQRHERFGQVILPAVTPVPSSPCAMPSSARSPRAGRWGRRAADCRGGGAPRQPHVGLLRARSALPPPGDLPRALPLLERAMGICQDADLPALFPQDGCGLGCGVYPGRARRRRRAAAHAGDGTDHGNEGSGFQALCRLPLGEAQLLAGRLEEAHTLAERALALARAHQERGNQAYALRLLGDIAAQRDPPESRRRPQPTTSKPSPWPRNSACARSQAHCHRGLGTLYATIGQREQARAALSAAIELYRAMDMTFWLPQAEAALAQVEASATPPWPPREGSPRHTGSGGPASTPMHTRGYGAGEGRTAHNR